MLSVRKLSTCALMLTFSVGVWAASPPVIEISVTPSEPSTVSSQRSFSQGNSELLMIVEQLQDEVRTLRGDLEQQSFRMKKMERQQLDRYRDLDRRISALMSGSAVPVQKPAQVGNATQVIPRRLSAETANAGVIEPGVKKPPSPVDVAVQPKPLPIQSVVKGGISDQQAYGDAFKLIRAHDYPAAIVALNAFSRDYPDSPRVANAHFWLGEVYYNQRNLELARESYALVLGQHPDHNKAPYAAYKLGVVFHELGDKLRALEYLDYVESNHPKSSVVPEVQQFKSKHSY